MSNLRDRERLFGGFGEIRKLLSVGLQILLPKSSTPLLGLPLL